MASRLSCFLLFSVLALFIVTVSTSQTKGVKLLLTKEGRATSTIVLAANASEGDRAAAAELQRYLSLISGATIPIGSDAKRGVTIWLGSTGHSDGCPREIDWARLDDDGFAIRADGKILLIAGGRKRGTLYGVYTLLESYLGCRKFSPTVEVIPREKTISLPLIDDTQVPRFKFRDAHIIDSSYVPWHKLDNQRDLFGLYVHTFSRLVPPEVYFRDHPEYYTKQAAGRVPDAQLCLTNPEVFRIVVEELRKHMKAEPDKVYWSVSQNDTFSPCGCDACRAIDSAEGSPSGSLLAFVNKVAEQFPDKVISTLAYQYTRSAPKNIYLWDYVVQFRNLMSPFPNLRVLQQNIRYFAKNGITHVFEQGAGSLPNEFKELRTYLIAKLLWDPNIKVDSVMDDFLQGYFGKAAPTIRKYIDTMHDALEASGEDLGIYGFPLPSKNGYLSPTKMDHYVALFDKAEQSVGNDTLMLKRVQVARIPLQFALLEQAKIYGTGERGFFEKGADSLWRAKPARETLLTTFINRCKEFGISALNEIGTTPDDYLKWSEEFLHNSMKNHLALSRPVALKDSASTKYHNGDETALTDGLKGLDDYHLNWLGFHGVDMEATIDLGSSKSIRRVQTDFLQDINAWIFMPRSVEFSVSNDGWEFQRVVEIQRAIPQDRKGIWRVPFVGEFGPLQARYVRVKATSLKQCPDWHKGAGGLCWIFADEIIVE